MKTDESVVDKNENGRLPWINHRFFKALIFGLALGLGFLVAAEFRESFMIEPQTMVAIFIADVGVPIIAIIAIYVVANLIKSFLSRYGFEGFYNRNEKVTIAQLAISLVGLFLGPLILIGPFLFGIELLEKIGGDSFAALVGLFLVGALALIALLRRVAQQRESPQS
ncbi:hypothetical protein [Candidatus Leptofilum sp.]|uniref:hypothetical protein n=1 Tax=Candidatus Leptofilum sp. TaxID=3241576 RepID=UPI003B5BAF69